MTPEKMTNKELAEQMDNVGHATHAESIVAGREAAKRLRTMPEPPKPEFCVGWKGKCSLGLDAEIHAEADGFLYGFVRMNNMEPSASRWHPDGMYDKRQGKIGNDLIPNTQKPEIWWRKKGGCILVASVDRNTIFDGDDFEKVEVRVLP